MKKTLLLSIISLVAITIFLTYSNQEYKKLTPAKDEKGLEEIIAEIESEFNFE